MDERKVDLNAANPGNQLAPVCSQPYSVICPVFGDGSWSQARVTNGYKCAVILGQLTIMGSAPPRSCCWGLGSTCFRVRVTASSHEAEDRRPGQSCMLAAGVEAREVTWSQEEW